MTPRSLLSLIAGAFLLLGCAQGGQYPLTGQAVGIDDQVRFMSVPSVILH
jgi:hypothetical protein